MFLIVRSYKSRSFIYQVGGHLSFSIITRLASSSSRNCSLWNSWISLKFTDKWRVMKAASLVWGYYEHNNLEWIIGSRPWARIRHESSFSHLETSSSPFLFAWWCSASSSAVILNWRPMLDGDVRIRSMIWASRREKNSLMQRREAAGMSWISSFVGVDQSGMTRA